MSLKLLITGAEGMLGKNIALSSKFKKYKLYTTSRQKLDLKNIGKVEKFINKSRHRNSLCCKSWWHFRQYRKSTRLY